MTAVIAEPALVSNLIADRQARGVDSHDEMWDGVYFMPPIANDEHQFIQSRLCTILDILIGLPGLGHVRPGVNVSDRDVDWEHNYRIPDVAVFMNGTRAINRGTYWLGGPDFAVEILSADDRTRGKFDFYASVGIRELLLIDRDPWRIELYRLDAGRLVEVGRSELPNAATIDSTVVPLSFQLIAGPDRPLIEVRGREAGQVWRI